MYLWQNSPLLNQKWQNVLSQMLYAQKQRWSRIREISFRDSRNTIYWQFYLNLFCLNLSHEGVLISSKYFLGGEGK